MSLKAIQTLLNPFYSVRLDNLVWVARTAIRFTGGEALLTCRRMQGSDGYHRHWKGYGQIYTGPVHEGNYGGKDYLQVSRPLTNHPATLLPLTNHEAENQRQLMLRSGCSRIFV